MSKKLTSSSSTVNVSNPEVCEIWPDRSAGKASLFRDLVLAVSLLAASSLLTAMPAAHGQGAHALEVNGSSLTIDDDEDILRLSSYTYEFWMKDLEGPTGSWRNVFCKGPGDTAAGRGPLSALRPDDPGLHFSHSTGSGQETADTFEGIPVNEWVHIALVLTALDGEQIIYQNGVEMVADNVSSLTDTTQSAVLRIGLGANVVLDDFRVWNYARTQEEIQADMGREVTGVEEGLVGYWRFNEGEGTTAYDTSPYENHGIITAPVWTTEGAPIEPGKPPVVASGPSPANGEIYSDTWANLSWRPGNFAVSHDVYMGDNFDDVNDGAAHTFLGNQSSALLFLGFTGYPFPDGLIPGTTYYWRVDEVNEAEPNSPWKGDIWSFWIPSKKAYEPAPSDGAMYIPEDVELSWTTGFGAKLHTVYFGDDFDAVDNATGGAAQTAANFNPGPLEPERTYYWRVDESDPPNVHKGNVWSFTTLPGIPITDPNLVGWWMFEEGSGTVAVDSSGYDNYGTLQGGAQWAIGFDGGGLNLDGIDDFVEVPHDEILTVDNEVTVMAWIHTSRHGGPGAEGYQGIMAKGNPPRSYSLYTQSAGTLHFSTTSAGAYVGSSSDSQVPLNEWVHVAALVAGGEHLYYINGEPAGTGGGGIELPGTADTATVVIGRTHEGATRSLLGLIDDARIYNRALTQDEIKEVMRGDTTLAWGPSPAHGSTPDIGTATPLSWSGGEKAAQHDVYFGIDKDTVSSADGADTTGLYRGSQSTTTYNPPEGVEWGGGPYYWRVDESNTDGTISKGKIWSFTVTDYLLVEDFEDYNDYPPDEIWSTWVDGFGTTDNGSTAGYPNPDFAAGEHYVETSIIHGGAQSMPLFYDNNLKISEVTRTLTPADNWTEQDVGVLSLWIRGDSANAAERLYVALNGVAVYHGDPAIAQATDWIEWPIPLSAFADKGVVLTTINTISIGLGDKSNITAGGSGGIYVDDMRLYRP